MPAPASWRMLPLVNGELNMQDAGAVVRLLEEAAEAMASAPQRRGSCVRLPARGRLLVTGDLHDNPVHLRILLRLAKLEASEAHHLVLQELIHGERLINGMDFSHRMLLRAAELVIAHPGQVHVLLANHELAQMTGRGVSKGAGNSVALFNDALEYVFGEAWEDVAGAIGRFIRAMPLALMSEGGIFCAHSLPGQRAMAHFDVGVLERELVEADYEKPHGPAALMVWGRDYREEQVEELAERWGVRLICLGHEHAETGIELRARRVLVLNTDHERATALPVDLATVPEAEAALMAAIPLRAVADLEEEGGGFG